MSLRSIYRPKLYCLASYCVCTGHLQGSRWVQSAANNKRLTSKTNPNVRTIPSSWFPIFPLSALATEHKCSFLITVPVSYHGGFMDTVSGTISSPHNSLLIAATNIQQCERFPSPLSMRDSTLSDVDRVFVKVLRRYISPPKETVITLWACSFSRHKAS